MNQEKAKVYPPEFRESSVKLALESEQSIAQTARDLGVNENTLPTWIKKYTRPQLTVGKGEVHTDGHLYEELKQLKKEPVQFLFTIVGFEIIARMQEKKQSR